MIQDMNNTQNLAWSFRQLYQKYKIRHKTASRKTATINGYIKMSPAFFMFTREFMTCQILSFVPTFFER